MRNNLFFQSYLNVLDILQAVHFAVQNLCQQQVLLLRDDVCLHKKQVRKFVIAISACTSQTAHSKELRTFQSSVTIAFFSQMRT